MTGTSITELHGFGLTFHQTGPLQRAEIVSVEQLAELVHAHDLDPEGSQLAAVPGFGPARIRKVRAAIHAWKAAKEI